MAAHWPHEPAENPIAAHLNATPKYVVTKTLKSLDLAGSHVRDGDVAESVNELKARGDGTIVVLGSGILVQTLIEHNLIDQYRLFGHPLVLGTGTRLFRTAPRPLPLRLEVALRACSAAKSLGQELVWRAACSCSAAWRTITRRRAPPAKS